MKNIKNAVTDTEGNLIKVQEVIENMDLDSVESEIDNINAKLPFPLAIDPNTGDYGYIKVGADTVTPFKTGSNGVEESFKYTEKNKSYYDIQNSEKIAKEILKTF